MSSAPRRTEPNNYQSIQIYLNGVNNTGTPLVIPRAQLSFTLTGGQSGVYSDLFTPANHSSMQLSIPLGPYPGTRVSFNVTAWLPWEGGAIDRIYSVVYAFNWSNNGGFWCKSCSLSDNLLLSSSPDVTSTGTGTTDLGTGAPVNISIHEPIQNVTISSAAVHFRYTDGNGAASGTLPMIAESQNTSYVVIPGLPPNSVLQFSVEAKDINDNPVSSGNYTYAESGPLNASVAPGYGLFYFEAIDISTGSLVTDLNFSLANSTWSEARTGTPLGFAVPLPVAGGGELPVSFGSYVVTVHAFGQTQTWTGNVSSQNPFVVTFFLSSGPVAPNYAAPVAGLTIAGIVGLIGAARRGVVRPRLVPRTPKEDRGRTAPHLTVSTEEKHGNTEHPDEPAYDDRPFDPRSGPAPAAPAKPKPAPAAAPRTAPPAGATAIKPATRTGTPAVRGPDETPGPWPSAGPGRRKQAQARSSVLGPFRGRHHPARGRCGSRGGVPDAR